MKNEKRLIDCRNCVFCKEVWKDDAYNCLQGLRLPFFGIVETEDCPNYLSVVRCKDCKHWHEGTGRCDQHSHYEQDELNEFDRDYFCAYGERKDDG